MSERLRDPQGRYIARPKSPTTEMLEAIRDAERVMPPGHAIQRVSEYPQPGWIIEFAPCRREIHPMLQFALGIAIGWLIASIALVVQR